MVNLSFAKISGHFAVRLTPARALFLCFLTGFLVRLVPEILALPYPIGWDTVDYAVAMKSGVVWPHWSSFFSTTWLFSALVVPLYGVLAVDPFLLLKVAAPLLYGLNVAGVCWFSRKALNWNVKLSLLAGGFFAVQLASLRISWDLLRNTLGMGLLLFALPLADKTSSKRGFVLFTLLSLLTVFAHEYSAVTLLAIVSGLISWSLVRKSFGRTEVLLFLSLLPSLAVFLFGVFLRVFPVWHSTLPGVIGVGDASSGRFLFLANYLAVKDAVYYYPTYFWLVFDVAVLFAVLYASCLYLVWKGFFRNRTLTLWTGLLLVGSFGCLVMPFFALQYWDRWMFMLVYPFTFYAVNGARYLLKSHNSRSLQTALRASTRKVKAIAATMAVLGCIYLATPVLMGSVNVGIFSVYPANTHFCSAPTVPYQDVDGLVQAMGWLDVNMTGSSCIVLHHAFFPWGQLYLDKAHTIVSFTNDVDLAVDTGLANGFHTAYFVWWNQNIGWYGITIPDYFVRLRDFGRISVYSYSL